MSFDQTIATSVAFMRAGDCIAAEGMLKATLDGLRLQLRTLRDPRTQNHNSREINCSSGAAEWLYGCVQGGINSSQPPKQQKPQQRSSSIQSMTALAPGQQIKEFFGIQNGTDDNVFTFYPRAFAMSPCSETANDTSSTDSQQRILTAQVVVLYNLAFLYHKRALLLSLEAKSKIYLETSLLAAARGLYRSALQIINRNWDTKSDDFEDIYCLVLALTNNLGHIHGHCRSHMMNFPEMRECLALMERLINYPYERRPRASTKKLITGDYEFFVVGMYPFLKSIGVPFAHAPAA